VVLGRLICLKICRNYIFVEIDYSIFCLFVIPFNSKLLLSCLKCIFSVAVHLCLC